MPAESNGRALQQLVVAVAMMQVRQVRVTVCQGLVLVSVSMRRRAFIARMLVLVMLVVVMHMFVHQRVVCMEMRVALR